MRAYWQKKQLCWFKYSAGKKYYDFILLLMAFPYSNICAIIWFMLYWACLEPGTLVSLSWLNDLITSPANFSISLGELLQPSCWSHTQRQGIFSSLCRMHFSIFDARVSVAHPWSTKRQGISVYPIDLYQNATLFQNQCSFTGCKKEINFHTGNTGFC